MPTVWVAWGLNELPVAGLLVVLRCPSVAAKVIGMAVPGPVSVVGSVSVKLPVSGKLPVESPLRGARAGLAARWWWCRK